MELAAIFGGFTQMKKVARVKQRAGEVLSRADVGVVSQNNMTELIFNVCLLNSPI